MMCICYSVLFTCIYMYLYELYQSECLSSYTLLKPLLFTGEGRLPAYTGKFRKQLFCAIQIQKRLLCRVRTCRKPRVFFFMSHGATILFDCINSSTNSCSQKRISEEEAEKNVTQNTTRFKFCGMTSHTCPDKCKGSFLIHTKHTQDEFEGNFLIVGPSLTAFCVALLLLLLLESHFQACPFSVFFFSPPLGF